MTIYAAMVVTGGTLLKVDAIVHAGRLWLVPNWLDTPDGRSTMPARIIRFDNLEHSDLRGKGQPNFVVQGPIPKELFGVQTPKQQVAGFEYHELPNILIARRHSDKGHN